MANTKITRFGELAYFTKVKTLSNTQTFNGCTNLEYADFVNITTMSGGTGTTGTGGCPLFYTKIKNLYLPNLVSLGMGPFNYNRGKLWNGSTITIGSSFSTISNQYAFGTQGIPIKLLATTPPTGSVLATNFRGNALLFVPDESVNTYKEAPSFANWVNYIKPISECPF